MKRTALRRYTRLSPVSKRKRGEVRVGKVSGTVRRYGAAKTALRDERYELDKGRCQWQGCGIWLPKDGSVFKRAHLAHILSLGAGGADTLDNTRILCFHHHIEVEHTKGREN